MGLAVVERRAGTLVWVQSKKNGSWWPGIVVDPTELHIINRRVEEAPVKLLGTGGFDSPPLEWLNLEKSRRIKAFRSEEFNNCIRKVNWTQYPKAAMEESRRVGAIRDALQLEEEMQKKFKKRKARGDENAGIVCQTKRNRHVYLPAQKDCVSDCSLQSNLAKCGTSIEPTHSVLSNCSYYGPDTGQGTGHSDDTLMATLLSQLRKYSEHAKNGNAEQKPKLNGSSKSPPCHITAYSKHKNTNAQNPKSKDAYKFSPRHISAAKRKQKLSNVANSPESVSRTRNGTHYNGKPWCSSELVTKTVGHVTATKNLAQEKKLKRKQKISNISNGLEPMVNERSFSGTKSGSYYEDLWDLNALVTETMENPVNDGMMDKKLIDVEVRVQASSIGNHVPLVSLMSRLNGKAVIGYPINIESVPKAYHNREIIATRLNLTKKKRTPVCYVSKPEYSPESFNIKIGKNHRGNGPIVASCVPLAKVFSEIRRAVGR